MYIYDNNSLNSSQNKNCIRQKLLKKIKTRILCSTFPENRDISDVMWEKYDRDNQAADGTIIRCMRITYRITKATEAWAQNA